MGGLRGTGLTLSRAEQSQMDLVLWLLPLGAGRVDLELIPVVDKRLHSGSFHAVSSPGDK